jgi:tryptophan 2,3-dioxygenase
MPYSKPQRKWRLKILPTKIIEIKKEIQRWLKIKRRIKTRILTKKKV